MENSSRYFRRDIYDKYDKNSYYVAENSPERMYSGDSGSRNGDTQQTDDNELINMIKNVMFNETINERKNMEDLRLELKHKNEIINILLHNLTTKENTCNTLIETMLKNNNHNVCDTCKIKESSPSNNINQHINHHPSNSNPLRTNSFIEPMQLHDIPSYINPQRSNNGNYSQIDQNEKVYSWINSIENSSIYESISNVSDTNYDGDFNYNNTSQFNAFLQPIDIESALNRNNNITPHSRPLVEIDSSNHLWPKNTCLIVGSSILNNLDERKLNKGNICVKVRPFPGSTISDMHSYITPLLKKKPQHIILHVGGNDAPFKSADDILVELLQLKTFIAKQLPTCDIYISQPTTRVDNMKAKYTIRDLNGKLNLLNINIVDNSNIEEEQLGRKGLHLNQWGTSRLAMNYLSLMRQF